MSKRLFISCVLMFSLCSLAHSQIISRGGVTAAGTYSNLISSERFIERHNLPGYAAGLFVESDITSKLSLVSSAEFSSQRYEFFLKKDESLDATHTMFYLSVPVLAKLKGPGFLSRFYGKIGPRFDFFLFNKHKFIVDCSGSFECGSIGDQEDVENSKTMVPGWSASLGTEFTIFGKRLDVELRFNDDFTTMNKDERADHIEKISYNIWFSFPISFK